MSICPLCYLEGILPFESRHSLSFWLGSFSVHPFLWYQESTLLFSLPTFPFQCVLYCLLLCSTVLIFFLAFCYRISFLDYGWQLLSAWGQRLFSFLADCRPMFISECTHSSCTWLQSLSHLNFVAFWTSMVGISCCFRSSASIFHTPFPSAPIVALDVV